MKQVIVQAGPYAGQEGLVVGTDVDYLGASIFSSKDSDLTIDYMKRLGMEPVSIMTKVFIVNFNGKLVALNNYELTGKEK